MTMSTTGLKGEQGEHPSPEIPLSSEDSFTGNLFEPSVLQALANQIYTTLPTENPSPLAGSTVLVETPQGVGIPSSLGTPEPELPGASFSENVQTVGSSQIPQIYPVGSGTGSTPSVPGSSYVLPQEGTQEAIPTPSSHGIDEEALTRIVEQLSGQIPLVFPQETLNPTTPTLPVEPTSIVPSRDSHLQGISESSQSVPSRGLPENKEINFEVLAQNLAQLSTQIPSLYSEGQEKSPLSPPSGWSDFYPPDPSVSEVNPPSASGVAQPSFYFLSEPSLGNQQLESHEGFDVYAIRRDFPILHQKVHGKPLIWLDNGATTQKPQSVIDSISRFYERDNSNIHRGAHDLAARATDAYEGAREKVQRFLGASSADEIVFVRGTTEGINLIAQTFGRKYIREGDEIILTTLEHHANIVPWQMLAQEKGAILKVVPITDRGEVILEEYARLLGPKTKLVAVSQVSNSLGTIVPVEEMTAMAHRHGVRVVIDGAQAVSHLPVNVQKLDADFYVFSGHKLFAPTGIGVVYGKRELLEDIPPWQGGGSMIRHVTFERTTYADPPAKFEAGTPSIADAVGLGAAIDYLNRLGMVNIEQYEHQLTSYATERLLTVPGLRLIGTAPHKVGVLSFILDNIPYEEVGKRLASEGIAVRAGHHCAQPSLAHYGLTGTVRPSLAFYNTREEIDTLVEVLRSIRYR